MSIKKTTECAPNPRSQSNANTVLQAHNRPHLSEKESANEKVGSAFAKYRVDRPQVRPSRLEPDVHFTVGSSLEDPTSIQEDSSEENEVYSYQMLAKLRKCLLEAQEYLSAEQFSEARGCLKMGLMSLDNTQPNGAT